MQNEETKQPRWQHLKDLFQNFDWQETREGVDRESRARIVFLGLLEAGKSTLFNQLVGWTVSTTPAEGIDQAFQVIGPHPKSVEDFGLFCLVDLPDAPDTITPREPPLPTPPNGYLLSDSLLDNELNFNFEPSFFDEPSSFDLMDPLTLAEGADLLVYVLDGVAGVQAADYRWVGRLRRLGLPLLVVLNKADLIEAELMAQCTLAEESAWLVRCCPFPPQDSESATQLLNRMIKLCPHLTVALGREIPSFRPQAAERLIRQTALINGVVALEPVPLLDIPIQLMTLSGLMLRIAAIYDRPPTDVRRREVIAALSGGLAGRYAAQQLVKVVPMVGWAVSGVIGWTSTWGMGRAAIAYFEAEGDAALERGVDRAKTRLGQTCRRIFRQMSRQPRWPQRPGWLRRPHWLKRPAWLKRSTDPQLQHPESSTDREE